MMNSLLIMSKFQGKKKKLKRKQKKLILLLRESEKV